MQPDSFQCPSSVYSVFPFISLSLYRYAALFLLCFIFRPYWISMKSNLIPIRSDWLRSLKRDFCLRNFSISNILFKCKENVSNSSFIALPHKIDALFTVPLFLHFSIDIRCRPLWKCSFSFYRWWHRYDTFKKKRNSKQSRCHSQFHRLQWPKIMITAHAKLGNVCHFLCS